ncbi:MAG: phosphoglycerate dehydrogenase [Rhodothermales bacterium]|nr:phosphoglycerate dehydrogenase [Rhodothermales bacterium]
MNILIADTFSESAQERLRAAGHAVEYDASLKGAALTRALGEHEPEALIVRSTKVTADDLDAGPNLELIVRAGAGYDTIDVEGASARGIFVANCPGKNAAAVAELAFGLLLGLDRRIPDNVAEARAGRWNKAGFSKAQGVMGQTLGLVGLGNIGQEMIPRAKAFGMKVVAWSRSLTDERAEELGVRRAETPLDVARAADVVSVHVASTPDTKGLIDRAFVRAMKPGAALINTSRAAVVDEGAVREAMDERDLRFATDVPTGEPADKQGAFEHPLAEHPNLYLTHHIGASTEQATEAIGQEAARVVLAYAETGRVPNCVNLADHSPATHLLTVRHRDRVGVLAGVLNEVSQAGWNVQEMENLIFAGAEAACARIRFDGRPNADTLGAIREQEHVLAATIIEL